jgi:hypothetical protein
MNYCAIFPQGRPGARQLMGQGNAICLMLSCVNSKHIHSKNIYNQALERGILLLHKCPHFFPPSQIYVLGLHCFPFLILA